MIMSIGRVVVIGIVVSSRARSIAVAPECLGRSGGPVGFRAPLAGFDALANETLRQPRHRALLASGTQLRRPESP